MLPIRGSTPAALANWLASEGFEPYRGRQILGWVYGRSASDPSLLHDLPQPLRERLGAAFDWRELTVARCQDSADGTRKFALRLCDEQLVEAVLIPDRHRLTLCVSSQVGCGMGCGFCATARLGLRRQLEVDEIVSQVMIARRELSERPIGQGVLTNIVFMGMGEPLHNLDRLIPALEILTSPWGLGISPRRITVSTVGLIPAMQRLLAQTQVQLAISLSATTEESRRAIMPVTRKYGLQELLDACRLLPIPRRRRITFEYVMLDAVNDSPDDARRLVRLLHGIPAKVNLICFNPFPGAGFVPTPRARVARFHRQLLDAGVSASVRESRGQDIAAACGQLAAQADA